MFAHLGVEVNKSRKLPSVRASTHAHTMAYMVTIMGMLIVLYDGDLGGAVWQCSAHEPTVRWCCEGLAQCGDKRTVRLLALSE